MPPLLLLSLLLAAPAPATDPRPAFRLEAGSIARHQIVAVGRDAVIEGEALADVAVLNGTARIEGSVAGDLVVLGGDVSLAASARLAKDVFVLGGRVHAEPGAEIAGRTVAYPSVSRAWLTLLEGPSLGLAATSPVVVAAKLALAAVWLTLVLVLFAVAGRAVAATSEEAAVEPFRCFATGLVGLATIVVTALFFAAFLPAVIAVPLLALVALLAVGLKLWGMVAVFQAAGAWILRRVGRPRRRLALHAAVAGLVVLAAIKLVPYVGLWVWTVASLIGIGAALRSKLGRREPWFDPGPLMPAGPTRRATAG